jgi:hypothetical protein
MILSRARHGQYTRAPHSSPMLSGAASRAGECPPPARITSVLHSLRRGGTGRGCGRHAGPKLSPDYRAVIVLVDIEGLSTAEVAQTLRLTIANVKSRVHRARLFLRKHLVAYAATGRVASVAASCA